MRIGTNYLENEVFYDRLNGRWVCGGCAKWDLADVDRYERIATAKEVDKLPVGDLRRLLVARSREVQVTYPQA